MSDLKDDSKALVTGCTIVLTIFIMYSFFIVVTLTQNTNNGSACFGDTVVFTCTSTTGGLGWSNGTTSSAVYSISSPTNVPQTFLQFSVTLVSIDGTTLISTATLNGIEQDTTIQCLSGPNQLINSTVKARPST